MLVGLMLHALIYGYVGLTPACVPQCDTTRARPPTRCPRRVEPVVARVVVAEKPDGARPKALADVSVLTARGICNAEDNAEVAILAAALRRDLQSRFSSRNRAANALLLAEDDETGEIVGCCGIDVQRLSPEALDDQRLGPYDSRLEDRPMLSSLAVSPSYRKRGIAKRLCRAAEEAARGWGYNEVLLKVESDNKRARRLYQGLGYRVCGLDKGAERPVAAASGMAFVSTIQVAMRKDLRYPPADVAVPAAALGGAAIYLATQQTELLVQAASLLAAGELDDLACLLRGILS